MEYILMKFGEEKYLTNLIEYGEMYFNTIEYFRNIDDISISDKNEGIAGLMQCNDLIISNPSNGEILAHASDAQIRFIDDNLKGNLYCMYALSSDMITENINTLSIDERMYKQQNKKNKKCVIIKNLQEFLNRVELALNNANIKYLIGFVKYYDEHKSSEKLNIFDKSNIFQYQRECRIYLELNENKPITINIGSIKDIAVLIDDCSVLKIGIIKNK